MPLWIIWQKWKVWRYQRDNQKAVNGRRTDNTMAKRNGTSNALQNITQKTENRATRTPLNTGGELNLA